MRYGREAPELTGYSGNISRSGMMLRAIRVFPPGTLLSLQLKLPAGTVEAWGHVCWAREGSLSLLPTGRIGMGIKFVATPEEILGLLKL